MAHAKLAIFRRRLFTMVSAMSLILCIATIALWVRSYWRFDIVEFIRPPGSPPTIAVASLRGHVEFLSPSDNLTGVLHKSLPAQNVELVAEERAFFGFRFVTFRSTVVDVPHWFLAVLFALLPGRRLVSIIRTRRRHRLGLCPTCGYDLRATPDRCPECGGTAT